MPVVVGGWVISKNQESDGANLKEDWEKVTGFSWPGVCSAAHCVNPTNVGVRLQHGYEEGKRIKIVVPMCDDHSGQTIELKTKIPVVKRIEEIVGRVPAGGV